MLVRVRVVIQRALWRSFLGPRLEGSELLERRQVVAAAGRYHLLDGVRLRQMHKQPLGRLLVLGELPDAPIVGKERREPSFRTDREAVRPALLGNLRRIA